ncbi:hypothetical protein SLS62_005413 [Diatrype stigma]|uniref:methionine--tRNA ligase n=1 Tax=Diatrype stigma TaxID=117547 RepID=A0AAN9YSK2_9PEZI
MATSTEPVLPSPDTRNILITSALPYVNNVPHLGNIIGSVLSADVFARYCRGRGYRTVYVCGSDEYGTASETKALEEGMDPASLCAKYHALHKEIYDWFRIGFDVFGRTPTVQQTEIVQKVFSDLWRNGYIEERETIQPYCPAHQSFLADRFVEGECSLCHDPGARGDQCDRCGSLLDPLQPVETSGDNKQEGERSTGWLINPRCKLDGATPERRATKHLFLRLDALQDEMVKWFSGASAEWSANCIAITKSWIDKGLQARGITRDLKWGVPIPKGLDGLDDAEYAAKVFYVWFDACIGYVSITKAYTDGDDLTGTKWEQWWKNPENVSLYQFMGKDNVPFHTIIFPASQIGTKENWTKVSRLSTTEYLNYEGGKFSKSRNVGVFGNSAKETGIDADIWRYYLLSRRPEVADSEFRWQEFIDGNNNDLLKNLGNFSQRIIKFCAAKMDSVVPDYESFSDPDGAFKAYKDEVNSLLQTYISNLEDNKLRAGLATILTISGRGNKLLQDNTLSNQLLAEDPARCAAVIGTGLNTLHLLASILSPYMPTIAESIFRQLGVEPKVSIPSTWTADFIKPGQAIGKAEALFSIIPASKADEWRDMYGGDELRKQKQLEAEKAAAKKAAKQRKKQQKQEATVEAGVKTDAIEKGVSELAVDGPAPGK